MNLRKFGRSQEVKTSFVFSYRDGRGNNSFLEILMPLKHQLSRTLSVQDL